MWLSHFLYLEEKGGLCCFTLTHPLLVLIKLTGLFPPTRLMCGRVMLGIEGKTASGPALKKRWGTKQQTSLFAFLVIPHK